jgi:hypothetical protein
LIRFVIALGSSRSAIVPCGESAVLQVHDARAHRRDRGLRHHERVAVPRVEPDRDVTRELEMLALVVAHGHAIGVVGEDVGGHEDRVVEQPDAHRLLAPALVLELRHPAQLAHRGDAVQEPGELGVRTHVALHEEHASLRVEARREQQHRGVPSPRP